jgi:antirestriction protein ArdC
MPESTYERVTRQITDALKAGTIPWRRPWSVYGPARNIAGRPYRGANQLLLGLADYEVPVWLTFRQAASLGGSVRKGERGWPVILWKPVRRKATDRPPENEQASDDGYLLTRTYTVFNVAQCDGIPPGVLPKLLVRATHEPITECERIVAEMPEAPALSHGGDRAAYSPSADRVMMPPPERFTSGQAYYHTLFHELAHSTGHPRRLDRDTLNAALADTKAYAREELVAEIAASFVAAEAGLDPLVEDQAAPYLAAWLSRLEDDPRLFVIAAGRAQRAADWILDRRASELAPEASAPGPVVALAA